MTMSKPVTCPRCHGPATMIDKAPRGEHGDVVRCDVEKECAALTEAAKVLEQTHAATVDAAHEFTKAIGDVKPIGSGGPSEIKIPSYIYIELLESVREWKEAGQSLHDATIRFASVRAE